MAKNSQVNIRFDDATDALLESTASDLGISKSALVRHLTGTFLDDVQRTGSLKLRPDWLGMLGRADARSAGGDRRTPAVDVSLNDSPGPVMPALPPNKTSYPKGKGHKKPE